MEDLSECSACLKIELLFMDDIYQTLREVAAARPDQEVCGFLLRRGANLEFYPCANSTPNDPRNSFQISAGEQLVFANNDATCIFFHSHVDDDPKPSPADIDTSEALRLPFLIYSNKTKTFDYHTPVNAIAPFEGRQFCIAHHDCWGLLADYYLKERAHKLPYLVRSPIEIQAGIKDLKGYMRRAGFKPVGKGLAPEPGDFLLFDAMDDGHTNHAGVYLGGDSFLHQLMGLPSRQGSFSVWANRCQGIYTLA